MAENDVRMRLRRTNSTSRAEDIVTEDAKVRRSQADKPIHSPRDSLLSWSSGFQNFEGMINWAFLLLAMGGIRLFLENINKYGVRVNLTAWMSVLWFHLTGDWSLFPSLYLMFYTNVPILLSLLLEKLIAKDVVAWRLGCFLHMLNLFLMLLIPILVINVKSDHIGVLGATVVTLTYSILFLKLWSYVQVNHWCRCSATILGPGEKRARHQSIFRQNSLIRDKAVFKPPHPSTLAPLDDVRGSQVRERLLSTGGQNVSSSQTTKPVVWPANLGVVDIYFFWLAPTLCYELNFPRTSRIRKSFLVRRAVEVLIGANVAMAVVQQWIIPSVVNSLKSFASMDPGNASERLLKLALPNHLLWLICFYLIFHSCLNTLGEVLGFADRDFYHDWWNANNIPRFWALWNLPVHRWCVRHLYKPLLRDGNSKMTAMLIVFFTSAFFHEYLISVPLRLFKVWGFLGMMVQAPLFPLSLWVDKAMGPRFGNALVWLSLIVGQPLAVMMYYHDYVVEHFGRDQIMAFGQLDAFGNQTTLLS